eukprot:CAMPEP_0178444094 /NCGR_PEP_ID=MMETSP0689_2-20121128/39293_1 /TAXON_ID=160604 /ORGANISM="Amphidinium massartii, Strain CS-259" /LENGTH=578 /DNA_ID=CAMNT_0020068241 /DNA_START=79 /DNA_END=1812 /DNA_ORIENTATION=-
MSLTKLILVLFSIIGATVTPLADGRTFELRSRTHSHRPVQRHGGLYLAEAYAYQEPAEGATDPEIPSVEANSETTVTEPATEAPEPAADEGVEGGEEGTEGGAADGGGVLEEGVAEVTVAPGSQTAAPLDADSEDAGGEVPADDPAADQSEGVLGEGQEGIGGGEDSVLVEGTTRSPGAATALPAGEGEEGGGLLGEGGNEPGQDSLDAGGDGGEIPAPGAREGGTGAPNNLLRNATTAAGTTMAATTTNVGTTVAPLSAEEIAIKAALTPPDLMSDKSEADSGMYSVGGASTEEYYTHWEKVGQSSQPYDTLVGARLFDVLDEVPTKTPPPSQMFVSQTFVAQCPIIMFSDSLYIRAPTCNETTGSWVDPATDRVVLRWRVNGDGSLVFGVDSASHGSGGMTFATMQEELTLDQIIFQLRNCVGVLRWTMEEEITQVQSMGPGGSSMDISGYDPSLATSAFFLRYQITGANGTLRSSSNLFRMNSNSIEFTQPYNEESVGPTMAQITRHGGWTGSDWRQCDGEKRQWQVTFTETQRTYDQVATVMDPRVAIATIVTMMAVRDESRDPSTGITTWARW